MLLECRFKCRQESPARHGRAIGGSSKLVDPHFKRRNKDLGDSDHRIEPVTTGHRPASMIALELRITLPSPDASKSRG
jgi:hypothetical protein